MKNNTFHILYEQPTTVHEDDDQTASETTLARYLKYKRNFNVNGCKKQEKNKAITTFTGLRIISIVLYVVNFLNLYHRV